MVLTSLVSVLNMMIVGRLGSEGIAAVGLPQQPFFFAMALVVALNVGTTAIVARSVGGGREDLARLALRQNWVLSAGVGVLLFLFFLIFARPVVAFMGGEGRVIDLSARYLRIISVSMPLFTMSSTALAALRGAGDTRTPMYVTVVSNLFIVVLGLPLIYGWGPLPALEVAGAGWALLGASVYMVAASTWAVLRKGSRLPLDLSARRFDPALLRQTLHISLPSAAEQALLQAGLIVFVRTVAGMGTVTFAAHQILLNVLSISWQPAMGFAVAATALAGQYLGAGRADEAEAAVRQAQRFGLYVALGTLVILIVCGRAVLGLYTSDPEVIREAVVCCAWWPCCSRFNRRSSSRLAGCGGPGPPGSPSSRRLAGYGWCAIWSWPSPSATCRWAWWGPG